MGITFAEAVMEAEDEAIVEACRSLGMGDDATAYAVARNRRLPGSLGYVTMMGGDAGDWVRMMIEAMPIRFATSGAN